MEFIGIDMIKINKIISILTHMNNFITKITEKVGIDKVIHFLIGETISVIAL